MTDIELTRALEKCEIANEKFHHLSHLHVAWVYLSESSSVDEAAERMRRTLRRFAASAGAPEKYHDTITVFWMRLLAGLRASASSSRIDEVVKTNPRLLEKNFPLEYYSRETLFSDQARASWVEPDLKPLPDHAIATHSPGPESNPSHRIICR